MRSEPAPIFTDSVAEKAFNAECSPVTSIAELKAVDGHLNKNGLEVLLLTGADNRYTGYRVVPQQNKTVLSLSSAHVIALRKYLSLDMGLADENPALYLLLKDCLEKTGGFRGYKKEDNDLMLEYCEKDPNLSQYLVRTGE